MTTHELREAVLTSASAEARARNYVERRLFEVRESLDSQPAFFLQAMPLIAPETPWDVLTQPYEDVVWGHRRRNLFQHFADLASNVAPRPTIDGILGRGQLEPPTWETEIHRTGYASALYRDIRVERVGNVDRYVFHSGMCDVFRAFCYLLKELLDVSGTDVPYLVTAVCLNAKGTCIWTNVAFNRFSEPYAKSEIRWPEHLRPTGADPMPIADRLCLEMFNAFGFRKVAV